MKRFSLRLLAAAAAIGLFAALVYAVLLTAQVAEPRATAIHGPTFRRLWATASAGLACVAVAAGGLALVRREDRFNRRTARLGAATAGLIAAVNGGVVLAIAHGGPGTGNGVVGAAAAVVLGLIAAALAGVAQSRSPR